MEAASAGPTEQQKINVAPLFNDLQKYLTIKDYRQALKITNKILHSDGFRDNYRKLGKVNVYKRVWVY